MNLNKTIMITVSENAKKQAIRLMQEDNSPEGSFIRVGVKGGGCSGLTYELTFDHVMTENDKAFEDKGVKIVCDKKSILYLAGTELDFSGGLNGKGFIFKNPNANRTCGCGESFSLWIRDWKLEIRDYGYLQKFWRFRGLETFSRIL